MLAVFALLNNMSQADIEYSKLLNHILSHGIKRDDRTGTGTISVFGYQSRYDLSEFPLLTTKRVFWKGVVGELLWFLKGDTSAKRLREDFGVTIWDEWERENGDLGPVYGAQWRSWPAAPNGTIDQIAEVIKEIKSNPYSRRLIVSAWNVAKINDMALPPCHAMFQFYVTDGKLSCQLYQRSGDVFLGVPFNIASYALLTHMIAQVTGLKVGEFIHTLGDAHIYLNHLDQVKEQLSREGKDAPTLIINKQIKDIDAFAISDIKIESYDPHPAIKAPVSV